MKIILSQLHIESRGAMPKALQWYFVICRKNITDHVPIYDNTSKTVGKGSTFCLYMVSIE